jgi:hypothetical protein
VHAAVDDAHGELLVRVPPEHLRHVRRLQDLGVLQVRRATEVHLLPQGRRRDT